MVSTLRTTAKRFHFREITYLVIDVFKKFFLVYDRLNFNKTLPTTKYVLSNIPQNTYDACVAC